MHVIINSEQTTSSSAIKVHILRIYYTMTEYQLDEIITKVRGAN